MTLMGLSPFALFFVAFRLPPHILKTNTKQPHAHPTRTTAFLWAVFDRMKLRPHLCPLLLTCFTSWILAIAREAAPESIDVGENTNNQASIVGGAPVDDPGVYPFFAIPAATESICGATAVLPDILLTAAHCYRTWGAAQEACIGTTKRDCSDASTILPIVQIYIHPDYEPNTFRNDIMLIKLATSSSSSSSSVLSSNSVVAAAAWNANAAIPADGSLATVIGLGLLQFPADNPPAVPDGLQELSVTIKNPDACDASFEPETMICADGREENTGACLGDS